MSIFKQLNEIKDIFTSIVYSQAKNLTLNTLEIKEGEAFVLIGGKEVYAANSDYGEWFDYIIYPESAIVLTTKEQFDKINEVMHYPLNKQENMLFFLEQKGYVVLDLKKIPHYFMERNPEFFEDKKENKIFQKVVTKREKFIDLKYQESENNHGGVTINIDIKRYHGQNLSNFLNTNDNSYPFKSVVNLENDIDGEICDALRLLSKDIESGNIEQYLDSKTQDDMEM